MQLAFLILVKLILTELGPFDFSHFEWLGEKCRLVLLRCKGTPPCFPAILAQRDNFCDFLFASLDIVALQTRDLLFLSLK